MLYYIHKLYLYIHTQFLHVYIYIYIYIYTYIHTLHMYTYIHYICIHTYITYVYIHTLHMYTYIIYTRILYIYILYILLCIYYIYIYIYYIYILYKWIYNELWSYGDKVKIYGQYWLITSLEDSLEKTYQLCITFKQGSHCQSLPKWHSVALVERAVRWASRPHSHCPRGTPWLHRPRVVNACKPETHGDLGYPQV